MIPPAVTERLEYLRDELAEQKFGAEMTAAEIRGMEAVIEAVAPLLAPPQEQEAAPMQSRRRNVRNLVLELVRREPGLPPAQIAERIGCRKSQVDNAVAYWRSSGAIDLRFGDGCYPGGDLMHEVAQ